MDHACFFYTFLFLFNLPTNHSVHIEWKLCGFITVSVVQTQNLTCIHVCISLFLPILKRIYIFKFEEKASTAECKINENSVVLMNIQKLHMPFMNYT